MQEQNKKTTFDLKLIEFDDDEKIICEIKKHSFGLFIIFATGFFVIVLVLIATAFASAWINSNPSWAVNSASTVALVLVLAGLLVSVLAIIVTAIAAYLYQHNIMLVTTDKIAQLLYLSIFNRKISQLSINDVQDVTVTQRGIFAHAFNYGTIVIETAGEQQNYTFTFAPHPYDCSRDILTAHEINVKKYGN